MPVKNFKWTYPKGVQPPKSLKEKRQIQKQRAGDFLRLPVGVATALMQQRLSQEQKLGVQFAASSDEPKWSLLKTLRQQIPDAAFLRADAHRLAHIQKLLKWASDAKVVTEVGPLEGKEAQGCASDYLANDPQCMSAEILQKQLRHFEEEPRVYDDVMRYPFSSELLYWGSFKVLRFHGRGLLFHRNGVVAYNGTWVDGAMSGEGELMNEQGTLVWKGEFGRGVPHKSLLALFANLHLSPAHIRQFAAQPHTARLSTPR